jgi:valyl-tRNA synthetase
MELETRYDPSELEPRWYAAWEKAGYFHADEHDSREPFTIVIPPPNVTGVLHLGHAMNNTFQDALIRLRRMQGKATLWMPGTDHAGIATQNVVEKELRKEGKKRHDLGREKFLERVWDWKEKNGSTIIRQLKRIGSSCDWPRERFTMDEGLSAAVVEVFVRLHEKGLIYRGERLVNWCPRCATALSDEEAIPSETEGALYRIKYPILGEPGRFVTVATTRPETMLGDTAVAVHPEDERYRDLIGLKAILPLMNRDRRGQLHRQDLRHGRAQGDAGARPQ